MEQKTWEKFGFACLVAVVGLILAIMTLAIFSDGRIDYCKVVWNKDTVKNYQLLGHRPWRTDEVIASNLETVEDAIDKANQISCEIR